MEALAPYVSLAVALGVGLLIGMEREQASPEGEDLTFLGGARTHALFALAGALSALLARSAGVWVVVIAFVALMSLTVSSYIADVRAGRDRGMTSEAAFAITFLLGALALSQGVLEPLDRRMIVVAALGVAVTALLSAKPLFQRLIEKTSKEDVYATLKFLIVAVIVLPLLPNQTYGPLDVLNPFEIGLMVVLIAGIGFVGYVAVRIMGSGRGLALTGFIGGLVSSTSVTLSFSGRAKEQRTLAGACALAVVAASSIMFPRVLIEVAVVNPGLLPKVAIPLGAMTGAGAIYAFAMYRATRSTGGSGKKGGEEAEEKVEFDNPFELGSAIKFGLVYALVLLVAVAATRYLGAGGTYVAGLLAGTTDVDAITLSMANQAKAGLDPSVAATTIMLGAASNTIVKAGLAIGLGGWAFGKRVALAFAVVLAAGGGGLAAMWLV